MPSIWSKVKDIPKKFQKLQYARLWALLSLTSAAFTLFCLFHSLEILKHKGGEFVFFIVASVIIPIFHLLVVAFAPQIRYFYIIRCEIQPPLLAFITMLVAFLPTILIVDEAATKKTRALWILGVILSTNVSLFCLQMICLPSFDLMFTHTGLSSAGIVLFHVTEDVKIMWFWRIFGMVLCGLALICYHWMTHPVKEEIDSGKEEIDSGRPTEGTENTLKKMMKKIKETLEKLVQYTLLVNAAHGVLFCLLMFVLVVAIITANKKKEQIRK